MSNPSSPESRRNGPATNATHRDNGHLLIVVEEWLPGREPTDYGIDLTADYGYRTRYFRCRNCGQERNRRSEFRERCEVETPPNPVADGGYSIEEPRTRRALTEDMDVRFGTRGPVYEVHSQSGNTYEVDIEAKTCTCPDYRKRRDMLGDLGCKHLRRVDLEIRARTLPRPDGRLPR